MTTEKFEWRTGKKVKPVHMFINEEWVEDAVCSQIDPELFHPEMGKSSAPAIAVCRRCPVTEECLAYALRNNVSGVWGATSENRRKHIRRELGMLGIRVQRPIEHGTDAEARAHYRAGEKPCASCLRAQMNARRDRRTS